MMRSILAIVLLIALAAGAWYWHRGQQIDTVYRTVAVHRGDIVSTINATGTLEPEEVVDVGAQVAGLIVSFGKDSTGNAIDYRSPVEPGMVLARIDDTLYKADVDIATAQLGQAKASLQKSQADLAQAQARLLQAQHTWSRAKTMGPSDGLSQKDYDTYQADAASAEATVSVIEAQIAQAKCGISQAQASLAKAQQNFDFCTICSPVKGVIIDRRVNVGQTVVSNLNAPSLFLIAKDLTRMQIWAAVNEADVGRIAAGMPVQFTCDAFPGRRFDGSVGKVRLNATVSQNVVMYTVEVRAENPAGLLLPYLTAKVQFQVHKASGVLIVPNAALRWSPSSTSAISPDARSGWTPDEKPADGAELSPMPPGTPVADPPGVVWQKDGAFVRPLEVKLGITDGSQTAVTGGGLKEGAELIIGEVAHSPEAGNKNPFLPVVRRH